MLLEIVKINKQNALQNLTYWKNKQEKVIQQKYRANKFNSDTTLVYRYYSHKEELQIIESIIKTCEERIIAIEQYLYVQSHRN